MASLAEMLAAQNPYSGLSAGSSPILSLSQQKKANLLPKIMQKEAKIDPQAASDAFDRITSGSGGSNPIDLAQSSLARAGGNLYDVGGDIINKVFDTNINTDVDDGLSNPLNADRYTGVSEEYRNKLKTDQDAVLQSVAAEDYWSATKNAANVAVRTAADSFATVPELAAGAALTSVGGLGIGVVANRLKKASDTIGNVKDRYDELKEISLMQKMGNGIAAAAKEGSRASIMTADIVQQQRNAYKEENNGEEPSATRLASMIALTAVTTSFQAGMVTRFYIPRSGKVFGKAKGETAKQAADKSLRKKFETEVKGIISRAEQGAFSKIGGRVVSGIGKVAAAGGAEAVQEYAQSWAEILGSKVGKDDAQSILESAFEQFGSKENQDQAITSAFLGGAAGAAIRGATAAPITAGAATLDVAVGTVKAAGKYSANKVQKAAHGMLSDTQREVNAAEAAAAKVHHTNLEKKNADKGVALYGANRFEDLPDDVREDMLNKSGNVDLSDARTFQQAKDKLIRSYKTDVANSAIALKGNAAYNVARDVSKNAAKSVAAKLDITKEDVDRVVQKAKDLGVSAVNELKEYKTSTTYGMAERAIEYGSNKTKEGLSELREVARNNSPEAIRKLSDILSEAMPEASKALTETANQVEESLKISNSKTDKISNMNNINIVLKDVAQPSTKITDPVSVGLEIVREAKGSFEDLETLGVVEAALAKYENLNFEGEGSIPKTVLAKVKNDLAAERTRIEAQPLERATGVVKKALKDADPYIVKGIETASEAIKSGVAKLDKLAAGYINNITKPDTDKNEVLLLTGPKESVLKEKEAYKVPYGEQGKQVIEAVASLAAGITTADDKPAANRMVQESFKNPAIIETISRVFDTKDPDVIQAIIGSEFPGIFEKSISDDFIATVNTVLNTETTIDTDSVNAKTADNTSDTSSNTQNNKETTGAKASTDTNKGTETVTRLVKPTAETKASGRMEIEPDDDNHGYIDKVTDDARVDDWVKNVYGRDNVCK